MAWWWSSDRNWLPISWIIECFCVLLETYIFIIVFHYMTQRVVLYKKKILHWYDGGANEMGWACGAYGWEEGVYRVLVGKPEGRRPLGRPRRRWVDNIRLDLQEVGCGYMDWTGLAQDRDRWRTLVSAIMNFRVPWNAGNFLTSCKPLSCSRRTLHRAVSKYDRGATRHS